VTSNIVWDVVIINDVVCPLMSRIGPPTNPEVVTRSTTFHNPGEPAPPKVDLGAVPGNPKSMFIVLMRIIKANSIRSAERYQELICFGVISWPD